jgi:hypothetical protein
MSDRLSIYNDALLICGERALATLSDNVQSRILLDQVWNQNGVLRCLEDGQWFFAMRAEMIDLDPNIHTQFGYPNAFAKPSDWVLTSQVSTDEFFRVPLTRYVDEAGYWYSDLQTIYVRFVSNDPAYGMNLAGWPQTFHDFVAAHFASKVILKLSSDAAKLKEVMDIRSNYLMIAKSRSAMAEPTKFPPPGSWSSARRRGSNRLDGGYVSGNLY